MPTNDGTPLPVELSELGARLNTATVSYQELVHKYDPVGFTSDGGTLVVTQSPKQLADYPILDRTPEKPNLRELGSTGQTNFGFMVREDYNPELRGQQGLKIYDRMRKSDAQVRATLRLVKTPVLAARWYVDAASPSAQDEKIAKWIDDNLNKWMTYSFNQMLTEILLMLDYGFYPFEKVFSYREGKVMWQKFAPRHPTDVTKWDFDSHGGLKGMYVSEPMHYQEIYIPVDKLAVFTFEMEAGNVEGTSVLRSAYKHWYFKDNFYKIDAIQKERHGVGIPMIVLPPNFTEDDKRLADEMGRNLRTNEKAHVVLPPLWELSFLKLEGQPVNVIESIDHHDVMIARNILGQFLNNPQGTSQEEQQQLFLKATRYIADMIRDVFNKYCIPQIVNWNWGEVDEYPELKVRRIGDTVDWRTISFAIRNFVGSGIIVPDDPLEGWVRQELDLPKADPSTERVIVAPQMEGEIPDGPPDGNPGPGTAQTAETRQNGGAGDIRNFVKGGGGADFTPGQNARSPRQSTASGMRSARSPGSNGRIGRDKSGG